MHIGREGTVKPALDATRFLVHLLQPFPIFGQSGAYRYISASYYINVHETCLVSPAQVRCKKCKAY